METFSETETIPFFGSAGLELCLRKPPGGISLEHVPDPFVGISREDPVARWFAGVLKTDLGQTLFPVAIRILRDTISEAGDDSLSNTKIEELWKQEHRLSGSVGEYRSSCYSFSFLEGPDGSVKKSLPLLFCKRKRLFFSPVCPHCGKRLTECREDDLLNQVSLKLFSESLRRYLYCPECSPEGRFKPAFFAKELLESEKNNPYVTDRFGLMSLWSKVRAHESAKGLFPCVSCVSYAGCFPEELQLGDAVKLLYPFSFYNFFVAIRKYAPFSLEHASDLVGGMPVGELEESMENARDEIGVRATRELLKLAGSRSFYFSAPGNTSKVSASEIFDLKLNLYCQVIRLVAAAWDVTGAPLIGIGPGNFATGMAGDNPGIPVFWEFKIEPVYVASTLYEHLEKSSEKTPGAGGILPAPLFRVRPEFMKLNPARAGKKFYGNLLISKCELSNSESRVKVWGTMQFSGLQSVMEESGFLKVHLGFEQGFSRNMEVVFQVKNVSTGKADLVSLPVQLGADEIQQFQILASQPSFEVSFQFVPNFTISSDLYSAGILGFRLFLCNRKVSLGDLVEWLENRKSGIKKRLEDSPFEDRWMEFLREDSEAGKLFDARNICFDPDSRDMVVHDVDGEQWGRFLGCLFNMIFSHPGCGYLAREDEGSADVWRSVIEDLENIRANIFSRITADAKSREVPGEEREEDKKKSEIGKILKELLSDLSWLEPEVEKVSEEMVEKPVPPVPPADRPEVVKKKRPVPGAPTQAPEGGLASETIIAGPSRSPGDAVSPPPVPEPVEKGEAQRSVPDIDELDRTVVLPSSRIKKREIPPAGEKKDAVGVSENRDIAEKEKKKAEEEVFLDETIVIRRKPKKE